MANRRMISQEVICCDDFLDMPFEAQALFFQLQIKADEYGFVQSPRNVLRMMGAKPEALTALIESGFVIRFYSGVIVMTHWKRANTLKNDRPNNVMFPDEFKQLREDEKHVYHLVDPDGIQRNPMESQLNPTEPSINSMSTSIEPSVNSTSTSTEHLTSDADCGALDKPARPPAPPVSVYTDPNTGKSYTLREYMERWHGVWKITDTTWKIVNSYRAKGLTDQLICFAFEQTVNANAEVEDAYFTTVLKDYLNAGFTTQEEAVAREQSRNS